MTKKMFVCTILAALLLALGGMPLARAEAADATITFAEEQVTTDSAAVATEGTIATITAPGTYRVTGTCGQGQLVVEADGAVTLLLDSLTLTSADGPVIDIRDAKEVTLQLPAGTQSVVTDAAQYTAAADGQDAAIFSKADMVIAGEGALTVRGLYNDGIASRDTLTIEGGTITVEAVGHGIKGKDYLMILGGTITVTAGGDGIKATNADQAALGYVQIDAGTVQITAGDDGISAISEIAIKGGEITIDTANNGMKSEGGLTIDAGMVYISTGDDGFVSQTESISDNADVTVVER